MSRIVEYVSQGGLRKDGRRPDEHRRVKIDFHPQSVSDGACTVRFGDTEVMAEAFGPRQPASFADGQQDEAQVLCEVLIAAQPGERRRSAQRGSKLAYELSQIICRAMQSVLIATYYPGSEVLIRVHVLRLGGSELAASLTACSLALAHAKIALRDFVVSTTVGFVDNSILVDLSNDESRSQCPSLIVAAMANDLHRSVLFLTENRIADDKLEAMVAASSHAMHSLFRDVVKPALTKLMEGDTQLSLGGR